MRNCIATLLLALLLPSALLPAQAESRPAMLTSAQGSVEVKPAGGSAWQRASLMMLLQVGDTLRTGKSSGAVVVFFGSGHRERLLPETTAAVQAAGMRPGAGAKRVPERAGAAPPARACVVFGKAARKVAVSGTSAAGRYGAVGLRVIPPAGPDLALLAPLKPKSRSVKPAFLWAAVEGADFYQVRIADAEGKALLDRRLAQPCLPFPKEMAPLRRGALYTWSVAAMAGDQELVRRSISFRVLAARSLARLENEEARLRRLSDGPRDTTAPVLLSRLYMEYGLCDEAIDQLEHAAVLSPNEPTLHEELGHLYRYVAREAAAARQFARAEELRK